MAFCWRCHILPLGASWSKRLHILQRARCAYNTLKYCTHKLGTRNDEPNVTVKNAHYRYTTAAAFRGHSIWLSPIVRPPRALIDHHFVGGPCSHPEGQTPTYPSLSRARRVWWAFLRLSAPLEIVCVRMLQASENYRSPAQGRKYFVSCRPAARKSETDSMADASFRFFLANDSPVTCSVRPRQEQRHVRESTTAIAMLLNLGGPLISSHVALYPLPPGGWALPASTVPSSSCLSHDSTATRNSSSSRRRRTRPNSAAGPTLLHRSGSGPEGVPSSLFKFQPRATPKKYPEQPKAGGGGRTVATAISERDALYAGLVEDSDLPDVSALLVEVPPSNLILPITQRLDLARYHCGRSVPPLKTVLPSAAAYMQPLHQP